MHKVGRSLYFRPMNIEDLILVSNDALSLSNSLQGSGCELECLERKVVIVLLKLGKI